MMKIEAFGFQPVIGKEYVVTFTQDGELLSTTIYNGSELPPVTFPDNSKINLSITDRETGKHLMSSEFISYNGKLYKSKFDLPLKNPDTNKNANIYIKDLHYDLTTGSILVQVQGFAGDKYTLDISDVTAKMKSASMPVILQDDTYYSIPTALVQGNTFQVQLTDEFGKPVDEQQFTAPISTDWRYVTSNSGASSQPELNTGQTDNAEGINQGEGINQEGVESQIPGVQIPGSPALNSLESEPTDMKPFIIGGGGLLILVLLLVLIIRIRKRRSNVQEDYDEQDYPEEDVEEFQEVDGDINEDEDEKDESPIRPRS